jgi:hypothetical protein
MVLVILVTRMRGGLVRERYEVVSVFEGCVPEVEVHVLEHEN